MADLRLIAAAVISLAGACGNADAQPGAVIGIKPPAGWQARPAMVSAVKDALGKVTIDGLEAFGEPAIGCYALWIALRGSGNAKELADQVLRGLTEPEKPSKTKPKSTPARKLEIKDVVKPTADAGILTLSFASAPYSGRLRARLVKDRITALACFSSQREPATCETACTTVLGSLP